VEIEGRIGEGPLILYSTHMNLFMDAIMVVSESHRKVSILTADVVNCT